MFGAGQHKARLLIIDDEPAIREVLCELLGEKYKCVEAKSAEIALKLLAGETFNLVISDIQMPGLSGLEMIPEVHKIAQDVVVVMISGQQNIESAIMAMRAGAYDYITKPFAFDHVEAVVRRALDHQSLRLTKKLYENHLEELIVARTAELRREMIEHQVAKEKVNRLASYDLLTNLPNPALFSDCLRHDLEKSGDDGQKTTIFFLSLDRFKNISDALGLAVGNELLRRFAERLSGCIRKTDVAAYFGGDEFALLATEVTGASDCVRIAQKIKDSLLSPFDCGGREVYLTASFGIALSPDDGCDCQTLLKNASTALHRARQSGGDNYQFYRAEMHDLALKSLSLENSLRRGLEREEFVLHYQPQISAENGQLTGIEALVRWQHPELGLVPPLEFIPIAEATGLIVPLGEWILRSACLQNAVWQRAGFPHLRIAVNLSLRQFQQSNLVETISRILTEADLEPQYLELELTESLLMDNAELTIKKLSGLRALGIKISIDDFGSGYSSLSYLKNLPVDALKIDRMFVTEMRVDSSDAAIVKTIITLAQNLGLKTIAEGVETAEQAAILADLGCDEMQGYFFSKPLPINALEAFLNEREGEMSKRFVAPPANQICLNY